MSSEGARQPPRTREELAARIKEIEEDATLRGPPFPVAPCVSVTAPMKLSLRHIQRYIASLEYNHTGVSYFPVRKDRGMSRIVRVAKSIMQDCLPIQCVEAVFLATHLTMPLTELDRFPLSFKSTASGNVYRHIVLAVRHKGVWGALGISRKKNLMDKPLHFASLGDLVAAFKASYAECGHSLVKVYVGLPLAHGDSTSAKPIHWRTCRVRVDCFPPDEVAKTLDGFAHTATAAAEAASRSGTRPPSHVLSAMSLTPAARGAWDGPDTSSDEAAAPGQHPRGAQRKRTSPVRRRGADRQ